MAGKVGMVVNYQPTEQEYPMSRAQMAAIITSWNEESEKADLAVFTPGQSYFLAKRGVVEGTEDGTFQQPSTQSETAKAAQQSREAQAKAEHQHQKQAAAEQKQAAAESRKENR